MTEAGQPTGDAWPDAGPRPAVRREVAEAVAQGMPPGEVAGRAKRSLSVVLGILESQGWPGGDPVACSEGCSTCCHQRVHSTAPEILELAAWLRGELSGAALEARIRAVERAASLAQGKGSREHWLERIPCGLLEAGRCVAYDARPLACRRGHSTSRAACERAWAGTAEPGARIPDNPSVASNAALFELGFREGFERAGRALDVYELAEALSIALRDPSAEARWLEGQELFLAARTYRAEEI